jgi:hypothetical protein
MTNDITMPAASLSMLLDGLVDFAGLFPPALLPMDAMVSDWARGLKSDHDWMLGRLIVPVSRLAEFESAAADLLPGDDEDPWVLSVLMDTQDDETLESQIERIMQFNDHHSAGGDHADAIIDVVELKCASAQSIEHALDVLPEEIYPFFEMSLDHDIRGLLATLVGSDAGAKVRTGGIRPELYPSTAGLADFIIQCAKADVPFKATAGLHHPLRNHNDAVDAMQFGFLNVFLAALVAADADGELTVDELSPLLTRGDLTGIEFTGDGVTIDGQTYDLATIEDARIAFALSFGSCSYDDPVNDLAALGLLSK